MATSDQAKAQFQDAEGRHWSTAITVSTIKRVRDTLGIDLLTVFDGQLLTQLASDPVLLVDTLYVVCKPQADEREVSDEAFGALLVGDAIEEAAAALVRGLVDFFPSEKGRVLERLWLATADAQTQSINLATSKLDSDLLKEAMSGALTKAGQEIDAKLTELGNLSMNSPEPSVSTPVP